MTLIVRASEESAPRELLAAASNLHMRMDVRVGVCMDMSMDVSTDVLGQRAHDAATKVSTCVVMCHRLAPMSISPPIPIIHYAISTRVYTLCL